MTDREQSTVQRLLDRYNNILVDNELLRIENESFINELKICYQEIGDMTELLASVGIIFSRPLRNLFVEEFIVAEDKEKLCYDPPLDCPMLMLSCDDEDELAKGEILNDAPAKNDPK